MAELAEQRHTTFEQRHRLAVMALLPLEPRARPERNRYPALVARPFVQLLRFAEAGQGLLELVAILGHQPEIADGRGDAGRIADLSPAPNPFAKAGFGARIVALHARQHTRRIQ